MEKSEVLAFLNGTWEQVALETMKEQKWQPKDEYVGGETRWEFQPGGAYKGMVKRYERGRLWNTGHYYFYSDAKAQILLVDWEGGAFSSYVRYHIERIDGGGFWVYPVEDIPLDWWDGDARMRFQAV